MEAKKLYDTLDREFIKEGLSDDWVKAIVGIEDYVTDQYKKRWMGLVCDFTKEIKKVYTAVFPSKKVMQEILDKKETDLMLFVHHPADWRLPANPTCWINMDRNLLEQFKEKRISIYNLHVPLDNFGFYSTSNSLARTLAINVTKTISPYFGSMAGVLGLTNFSLEELKEQFEQVVDHKVKLYKYGDSKISKVGVLAGGGNTVEELAGLEKDGANLLLTGVTVNNDYSKKAHAEAKKRKISILGGTHYSTEKFACINLIYYFKQLGVDAEFISDKPCLEDL